MRVFVTGINGQLGHDVVNELLSRKVDVTGSDITEQYAGLDTQTAVTQVPYVSLDITDRGAVSRVLFEFRPDVVIHCAAWTAVDAAEEEDNRERVFSINAQGTENIAEVTRMLDAKMLYLSTDYVFDGLGDEPREAEDHDFHPLNVYGESKLAGEEAVRKILKKFFIVRISWVFGLNGNNFVRTMINAGKKHPQVRVVNDQIGTPTYTKDLSRLLVDMVQTEKYGCYHASNEGGFISWYDFCVEIYRQFGISTDVIAVSTDEYGASKAARPRNSRLSKKKLYEKGFIPLPPWQDALSRYLQELERQMNGTDNN